MNEPRPLPPQGLPQTNPPHATATPRPAGAGTAAPPRSPIAPPPGQRLPGQPAHVAAPVAQPVQQLRSVPPPLPAAKGAGPLPVDGDEDLINLEDDDAVPAPAGSGRGVAAAPVGQIAPPSKIRLMGGGDKHSYTRFKRNTHVAGTGACRVRSFHGRLSDDGLAFMDDKINEWLDTHPEIEIKFVNCVVGPLEGKVTGEQALFVTIWY